MVSLKTTQFSKVSLGVMRAKSIFLLFRPDEAKAFDLAKQFESAGDSYLNLGKAGKAEKAYLRSLELAASGETMVKLGNLLLQEGRFSEALSYFDNALESDSSNITKIKAYEGKKTIYFKVDDNSEAVSACCKLGFLHLENKTVFNVYAAREDFSLAIKYKPACPEAYHGRAIAARSINNFGKSQGFGANNPESAISDLRTALELGFPVEKIYPKLLEEVLAYARDQGTNKAKETRKNLDFIIKSALEYGLKKGICKSSDIRTNMDSMLDFLKNGAGAEAASEKE